MLTAYEEIEKDIGTQLNDENFEWELTESTLSCVVKNNTKYEYSTVFEVSFYDKNGVMYDSDITGIEGINPGDSYVVEFYISDAYRLETFNWSNYYADIKY